MNHPFFSALVAALVVMLFLGHGTYADIYKYMDDQGQVHYANSPEAVPHKYRQQVEFEPELESTVPAPSAAPAMAPYRPEAGEQDGADDFGESKAASLKAREQALEKGLAAFQAEQAELGHMRETADTPEKIEAYHRKKERFQERFDAFHEKRKAFEKDARDYNEKVRQSIEQTLKTLKAGEKQK